MSYNSTDKEEICKNVDLSHLINKLVGKLGEDEVKKLLLNATSDCLEKDESDVISDDKVKETTNNKASNVVNKKEADIQNFNIKQNKESGGKELSIHNDQKSSSNCNFQEDSNINVKSSNERRESLSKQKSNINRNLLSSFIEVDNLKQKNNQTCIKKVSVKQKKSLDKSHVKQCKDSDLSNDLCSSHFTESVNTNNTNENNLSTNTRIDKISIDCVNQSDYDTLNLSDKNKSESTKRKSTKNRIEKASSENKEKTVSEKINKSEICSESSEPKIRKCEHKKDNFVKNDKNLKRNNKPEDSTDFSSLEEEKNLSKDTLCNEDALCENNVSTENKSNTRKRKLKRDNFSSEPRILRSRKSKPSCVSDDENTRNYSTSDKKDKSNISCENMDVSQAKQIIIESKLNVSSDDINNEIKENSKSLLESSNNQQNYKTELKEEILKKNNQKNIGKKQMKKQNNESEQIIMNKEENFVDQQKLDSNENLSYSKKNLKKKISNENMNLSKFSKSKTLKKTSSTDKIQIVNKEKNEIQKQCSDKSIEKTNVKMNILKVENSIIVKPCSVILKKENLEKELDKISISEEFSENDKRENDLIKDKVKTFKNQENNKLNNIVTNNYSLELNQEKKGRKKIIKLNKNNNLLNLNNVPETKIKDKCVEKNETKKQTAKEVKNKEECSSKKYDDDNQQSEDDSLSLRKEQSLNSQSEKLPINENEQTINDKNLSNVPESKIKDKSAKKNETKRQKAKEVKNEECSSKKFDDNNQQSENDSVSLRKEQSLTLKIKKLPINENEQTTFVKNLNNVLETKIKDKSVEKNKTKKRRAKEVENKVECSSKKYYDDNQQSENDSVSFRKEQSLNSQTEKLPINENEHSVNDKNLSNIPETKIKDKSIKKNETKKQKAKEVKNKEEYSSKKYDDDNQQSEDDSMSLRKEQSLNSQSEKLPINENEQTTFVKNLNNVLETKIKAKSVEKNKTKKQRAKEVKTKEECSSKKFDVDNQQSESDSVSHKKEQSLKQKRCKEDSISSLQTEKVPINENEQSINDKNLSNIPETKIKDKSVEKNKTKKQRAKEIKNKEECSLKKYDDDNQQSEGDNVSLRKEQSLNSQSEKLPINENEQSINDKNLSNVPESKIKDKTIKKNETKKQKAKEVKNKEECSSKKFDDDIQKSENDSVSHRKEQYLKQKRCTEESIPSLQTEKLPINENEQLISDNDKNLNNVPEIKIKNKSIKKKETKKQKPKEIKNEKCSSKKFDDDNEKSENDSVSLRKEQSLNLQIEKLPVNENEQINNEELKFKDKTPGDNDIPIVGRNFEKNSSQDFISEKTISVDKKNKFRKLRRLDINKKSDKYSVKQKSDLIESKVSIKPLLENTVDVNKNDDYQKNKKDLKINERRKNYVKEQFKEKLKYHVTNGNEITESESSNNENEQDSNNKIINSTDYQNLNLEGKQSTNVKNKSSKTLKQLTELHSKINCISKSIALTIGKDSSDSETNEIDKCENSSNNNMNSSKFVCSMEEDSSDNETNKIGKYENSLNNNTNSSKFVCYMEEDSSGDETNKIGKCENSLNNNTNSSKFVCSVEEDSSDNETNKIGKCENSLINNTNSSKFVCSMEEDSSDNETNKIGKCENTLNNNMNSSKFVCSMEKDSSVDNSDKNIKNDEHSSKMYENKKKHKIKFEEENLCKKKLKISKTVEQIKEKNKMSQSNQDRETDKTNKQMKTNNIFANKQNSIDKSGPLQKRKLKRTHMVESKKVVQIKQNLSNSLIENNEGNSSLTSSSLLPEEKIVSNNMESNKTDSFVKLSNNKNVVDDHTSGKNTIKPSETNDIECKKKKLKDKPLHKDVNKKEVNAKFINKKNILITKDLSSQSSRRKIVIIKKEPLKCNNDENLKKSESTKTEISINDDRNNNVMESSTEYSSNATKHRDSKIFKESTITKPKNILNEEESLETKFNENLSSPKFNNSQKTKMIANIKEPVEFELKMERNSPETVSLKNCNNGSCDNPEYNDSSNQINKKSFQTEDCDNYMESNHFSQDFITDKINIDNNFEPIITDIRHVLKSEWESPENKSENNISTNSDENQNIYKLNNKTIYQDTENSDASNEEAYDEYSELRKQFTNAGIKLEDAVSFIDIEKLKEMVINAGSDSCVLLRRAHYCPHSKQQVGPSLIVVKSHKKFMETKDAILCEKHGIKRCKVVLNELS